MESQKTILRGLVTATPTAITIQQLAKDYRNTIGEPIPYQKFGYNSLDNFLRSIPDTIQIQGQGPFALVNPVASKKSSHVMELVSKQKIEVKKSNRFRGPRLPLMRRQVIVTSDFLKKSDPDPKPPPQKMYYPPASAPVSNSTNPSNCQVPDNSFSSCDNSFENRNPINFTVRRNTNREVSYNSEKPPNSYNSEKPPVSYTSSNDDGVKQITKAIAKTSLSTTAMKLRNSHSSSYLPEADHDITPIKRNNIFNKSNNNIQMEDSEDSVPVSVKNNLKVLIRQHPDGIWCAEVPGVYRKMFKRELKYQDLGFRNLIDLCMHLKSIFHYVRPLKEDFRLYDRSKPLPDSAEQYFTNASFSSKNNSMQDPAPGALPSLNWSDLSSFLPPNVYHPGIAIPRTFVPEDTKEDDTLDIVVGEIFDVSKFWVYRDDGQLDKLMDDIQEFYKENANEYKIPQDLIRDGIYCVAIIIGEYHRALVVDAKSPIDDSIRVFFIDYGTIAKVNSEIYFLHEKFAELPAQTIRCRLANICPPVKGAPWSQESSKEFRRLIMKRTLTAKISRIDWKDSYLEIFLADVTDSHNVFYINNVLVENGFAVFPDQEQKDSLIGALSNRIVNLMHLFPTFAELEHGLAPSTLEMEVYHKCNTPINFCYPQYFTVDTCEEEGIVKHQTKFWETNIVKWLRKTLPHHHNIDWGKIKDKPLDLSLFGNLEEEMREYLGGEEEEELSEHCEEQSNNYDDACDIKKIEKWNETVNELREDCRLSEDIMNDLLNICDLNCKTDSEPHNDFVKRDLSEEANSALDMSENGDRESLYSTDECGDYEGAFRKHPLQDLSFSRSNSSCNSAEYSESDKYFGFLHDSSKSEAYSNADREELIVDDPVVKEDVDDPVVKEDVASVERQLFNLNNPFLQDLSTEEPQADIVGCGTLAASNPFLSYIPKEDNSDRKSDSTTSTDYGTCIQEVKVEKAWSTVDHSGSDMNCSPLSGSVDSASNTNYVSSEYKTAEQFCETSHPPVMNRFQFPHAGNNAIITNSVHVEQSFRRDNNVRPGLDISRPEFFPQNYYCPPQFYNYPPMYQPQLPHPAFANPYYNMRQQQVYMKSSYNMMQTHVPTPAVQKPIGPPPGFGPNPHRFDPNQNSAQCQDFYDAYNQILKQKFSN